MTLKEMREQTGLKQTELSAISGVNLRSLQDYEQGHKSILSAKGETLLRLSNVLGYSVEDILKSSSIEIELVQSDLSQTKNRILAYEKCLADRKSKVIHFPIIEADEWVDMSRIYPTKQTAVKKVLTELRGDKRISSLRLFGSSITMACHKDSDVDFALDTTDTSRDTRNLLSEIIQQACNWNADIIWMDHVTPADRIYNSIMKGMVLI